MGCNQITLSSGEQGCVSWNTPTDEISSTRYIPRTAALLFAGILGTLSTDKNGFQEWLVAQINKHNGHYQRETPELNLPCSAYTCDDRLDAAADLFVSTSNRAASMGNQATSQRSNSGDRSSNVHEFIRNTLGRGVDGRGGDQDEEDVEDERVLESAEREFELKPIEGKMRRNLCECARPHTRVDVTSVVRSSGKRTLYVDRQLSSKASETDIGAAENDLKMMCYLSMLYAPLGTHGHPNTTELLGYFTHVNSLHITTKYYELGNLMTMLDTAARLKEANDKMLPQFRTDKSIRALIHDIFQGVAFMHQSGIAHLDLALENIYIGLDGRFRVGDCRHSRFVGRENRCQAAPPPVRKIYAAPELHSGREIDLLKTDAWSLGVIVLMVLTMETPFSEAMIRDPKYQRLQLWGLPKLLEDLISECDLKISIPKDMRDLLSGLLCCNPEHRTSVLHSVEICPWLQASDARIATAEVSSDYSTTSSSSTCSTQPQSSEVEQEQKSKRWKNWE